MDETEEQIKALQQAYRENDGMQKVLDAFATYQNSMRTVNVDVIWNKVARTSPPIKRSEVVGALKSLGELDFGVYTKGAHGYPSRFTFPRSKGPLWVSLLAQGETEEEDLPDDTSETPIDWSLNDETIDAGSLGNLVVHKIRLRENVGTSLSLPHDLTQTEAKRLCLWIRSIPLIDEDNDLGF